jgi:hypothetical protein
MVVKLVPKFTKAQIQEMLESKIGVIQQAVLSRLQRIGETFVTNARLNGTYKDRTGNLRSSVGYVILKNGEQVFENFEGKTSVGKQTAKAAADEIASQYPTGYVLIGVAGMEYAAAVESRGYEVITSSSITAREELKTALQGLQKKIEQI